VGESVGERGGRLGGDLGELRPEYPQNVEGEEEVRKKMD